MVWILIAEQMPPDDPPNLVILANRRGAMGRFSRTKVDSIGEQVWWIDNRLYDGDDPPTHWLELPPIP